MRLQVYGHTLERSADVVEWVKGTALTRFERGPAAGALRRLRRRVPAAAARAIGDTAPYFYPFRRILFWGRKPG